MVDVVGVGLGGGAEGAEAVGGEDLRLVGQQLGEPVGRGVLVADQGVGVLGPEEVGPTGGAVQQRTAGEHADVLVAGGRVDERVGEVGERVAGGRQRGHAHPSTRPRRCRRRATGVRSKETSSSPLTR